MAVLENGFPFDNVEYDATALGAWLSTRTRGVFSAEDHYAVTLAGGMQVNVSSGIAWLKMNEQWGMVAPNPAAISLAVDVGDTILNRIDVVCLRIDKNQSVQEVVIKKGSLAASPVYPALVRDLNYDEIFLAAISVPAGTTELNASLLTDLRPNEEYCGLMRDGVTGIPTAVLQEQAEALISQLQIAIDGVIDGSQYMLKTAYDNTNEVSGAGGIVPYLDLALSNKANKYHFDVVTGDAPPITAEEDTIFIPASFSVVSYSSEEPLRPVDGELWLPNVNIFQVRSKAIRDTLLSVGAPSVRSGNSWQAVTDAQIMQDGAWQQMTAAVYILFENGVYHPNGTTGTHQASGTITSFQATPTMRGIPGASGYMTMAPTAVFDMAPWNRLIFEARCNQAASIEPRIGALGIVTGYNPTFAASTTVPVTDTWTTLEVDISALSGNYYWGGYIGLTTGYLEIRSVKLSK